MLAYIRAALIACAPFRLQIHLCMVSDGHIVGTVSLHTQQHQLELRKSGASGPLALLHSGGHGEYDAALSVVRCGGRWRSICRLKRGGDLGYRSGYDEMRKRDVGCEDERAGRCCDDVHGCLALARKPVDPSPQWPPMTKQRPSMPAV
jgi:hypothetical protein